MKRLTIVLYIFLMGVNATFAGNAKVLYADAYQFRLDIMNRLLVDFNIQLELAGTNSTDAMYIVLNNKRWPEGENEFSYFFDSSGKPIINIFDFSLPVVNGKTTHTISESVEMNPSLMTGNKDSNTFYYKVITWNRKTNTYNKGKMMQFTPDAKQLEEAMYRAGLSIAGAGLALLFGGWPSNVTTEAAIKLYSSPCTDLLSPSIMRQIAEEFLSSQYSNYRNLAAKYGYKDGKISISDQFVSKFSVAKDKFSTYVGVVSFSDVFTDDFTLDDIEDDLLRNGYEKLCDDRARYTIGDNVYNAYRYVNYKKQYCMEFGYLDGNVISFIFYRYTPTYNFVKAAHQLIEANVYNDYHKEISKVWDVTYGKKGKASNGNWLEVKTAPYCNAGTCRTGVIDATGKNLNVTAAFFDKFTQMEQYTKNIESQLKAYNYTYQETNKKGYRIYKGKYYAALKYNGSALSSITIYKPVKKPDPKKPGSTIIIIEPPIIIIQSNTTIVTHQNNTTNVTNQNNTTNVTQNNTTNVQPQNPPVKPEPNNNPPGKPIGNTGNGNSGNSGNGRASADSTDVHSTDHHRTSFDFIEAAEALVSSKFSNLNHIFRKYEIGICRHKTSDGGKRHKADRRSDRRREKSLRTFKCFDENNYLNISIGKKNSDSVRYVSFHDISKGSSQKYVGNLTNSLQKAGYTYEGEVKSQFLKRRNKETGTNEFLTVKKYVNKRKNCSVEVYEESGKGLQNVIFSPISKKGKTSYQRWVK